MNDMLWVPLALIASLGMAAMPFIQERLKAETLPMLFWLRVIVVVVMLPVVYFITGFPDSPRFYILMVLSSILYGISDIIYFNQVKVHGAGMLSRLIPLSVILSFFLWFVVDPSLIAKYVAQPLPALGIIAVISFAAFCASRLKKSEASWAAFKAILFVVFAATIGPILSKLVMGEAKIHEGPYAYALIQCAIVACFYGGYQIIRKPVPMALFYNPAPLRAAAFISLAWMIQLVFKNYALGLAENPAFVTVLLYVDTLWILLLYKLVGKQGDRDVLAGLGVVASAAGLVALKTIYFQ